MICLILERTQHPNCRDPGHAGGLQNQENHEKSEFLFCPRATAKPIGSYVIIFGDIEAYRMYLEKKIKFS